MIGMRHMGSWYEYLFPASGCTGHCSDCTQDWECNTCEEHYREETEDQISCIGNFNTHYNYIQSIYRYIYTCT